MKKSFLYSALAALLMLTACRTEFEGIRTSGDAERMLEAANKYFEDEEYTKAITLYELIIPVYRGKAEAEDIAFNFASANFLNGNYTLSSHYFKNFASTFGASPRKEDAMFNSAMSFYNQSPRYKLDQGSTEEAMEAFQIFANTYPESERVKECNKYIDELRQKLEKKAFESGKLYYLTRNYSSSIKALENMLKDYPDAKEAEDARFLIVKASIDWANNSIFLRQEERYMKTLDRIDSFFKRHPESEKSEEMTSFKTKCEAEINKIKNG